MALAPPLTMEIWPSESLAPTAGENMYKGDVLSGEYSLNDSMGEICVPLPVRRTALVMHDNLSAIGGACLCRSRQAGRVNDVDRPALDLLGDGRDVLTYEAEHEEVRAAQESCDEDRRGPAGHHELPQQEIGRHRIEPVQQAESAGDEPQQNRDLERCLGERDEARAGEARHLAEGVFCLARKARRRVKLHAQDPEAHPGDEAAKEAVALAEIVAEELHHAPGEQPEVGGVRLDGR